MYLAYSMAFTASFLAMLPYFIYKAIRHGKYAGSFKERLGLLSWSTSNDRPVIWVHAVSVGEFLAAEPLIRRLGEELPAYQVVVSTTTLAGQSLARDRMFKRAPDPVGGAGGGSRQIQSGAVGQMPAVFYFPFDWKFAVRRSLSRVHPALVVIMETEIWPNFLSECHRLHIKAVIANGRVSERSFSRYRLCKPFLKRVLQSITMMLMQTDADRERVILLGADPGRVIVCGNLKYDAVDLHPAVVAGQGLAPRKELNSRIEGRAATGELDRILGLNGSRRLVVAGSTAAGEEAILLAAFERVVKEPGLEDARLILAPRRPERFDDVARLIAGSSAAVHGGWARRSDLDAVDAGRRSSNDVSTARIILLDSIGELADIYRFAAVVVVGGSLVSRGGHNIIEPAAFAKPIIVGPHTGNFKQVVKEFSNARAVVQIDTSDHPAQVEELAAEMIRLLKDDAAAHSIGARARRILESNKGATSRTMTAIRATIGKA
jgi:3-deoxy-D-manno-octulosonic-acid transferase